MQGIAIPSTTPAATGGGAAGGSVAGVGAEDPTGSGGNLFGAILAGQLKGRTIAVKIGADGQLGTVDVSDALKGGGKDVNSSDISIANDALAQMLALANSGMLPVAIVQPQATPVDAGVAADGGLTVEGQGLISDVKPDGLIPDDAGKQVRSKKVDSEQYVDTGKVVSGAAVAEDGKAKPKQAEIAGGGNPQPVREMANLNIQKEGPKDVQVMSETGRGKDFSASLELATAVQGGGGVNDAGMQNSVMQMVRLANSPQGGQVEASQSNVIAPQVGSSEWGGALGDKIAWMASQGKQVAELQLNPPNLGPLEVRVTMGNDQQASIVFVSHQPAVRDAIETAMPRLREMLADSGIMLGNSMVGAESFQQQQQQAQSQKSGRGNNRGDGSEIDSLSGVSGAAGASGGRGKSQSGLGMVDMFV